MKLYTSATSPFARKARMVAHEMGLSERIELVRVQPGGGAPDPRLWAVNTLGKVPALELDDGTVLVDSPVICEYLVHLGGGNETIFPPPPDRFAALRLQALGDGITESTVPIMVERRKPDDKRMDAVIERHQRSLDATLALLDGEAKGWSEALSIGAMAVIAGLGYMELRFGPGWRQQHPTLAGWLERMERLPAVSATAPEPA